jgi:hypothetical protein
MAHHPLMESEGGTQASASEVTAVVGEVEHRGLQVVTDRCDAFQCDALLFAGAPVGCTAGGLFVLSFDVTPSMSTSQMLCFGTSSNSSLDTSRLTISPDRVSS